MTTASPVLIAVTVESDHVTFTPSSGPELKLPKPVRFSLDADTPAPAALTQPITLSIWAGKPRESARLAYIAVEPYTAAGQAALMALGYPGPYPVPEGVTLGGYSHGTALTEHEALTLAGLPDFPEHWVICPCESGGAPFTLLWGNAASDEQLERSSTWATLTAASLRASDTPRGSA